MAGAYRGRLRYAPHMVRTQPSRSIELLVAAFVARLTEAVGREIDARTRVLTAEYLALELAAPAASGKSKVSPGIRRTRTRAAFPEISREVPSDVPTDGGTDDRSAGPIR